MPLQTRVTPRNLILKDLTRVTLGELKPLHVRQRSANRYIDRAASRSLYGRQRSVQKLKGHFLHLVAFLTCRLRGMPNPSNDWKVKGSFRRR